MWSGSTFVKIAMVIGVVAGLGVLAGIIKAIFFRKSKAEIDIEKMRVLA